MFRWLVVFALADVLCAQSNPELKRLYAEDQKDREGWQKATAGDWTRVAARDARRRARVREFLATGALQSAADFHNAAIILQHGDTPNDFLLAHVLAMAAVSKGDPESRWLTAATLDRYLQAQKQPQVFGTQYARGPSGAFTQAPYDTALLSDALRREFCVSAIAGQRRNVAALNKGEPTPSPDGCR